MEPSSHEPSPRHLAVADEDVATEFARQLATPVSPPAAGPVPSRLAASLGEQVRKPHFLLSGYKSPSGESQSLYHHREQSIRRYETAQYEKRVVTAFVSRRSS